MNKYCSAEGWKRGYRFAVINTTTGKAITIAKTEEEAHQQNSNYFLFRSRITRKVVPITEENVGT